MKRMLNTRSVSKQQLLVVSQRHPRPLPVTAWPQAAGAARRAALASTPCRATQTAAAWRPRQPALPAAPPPPPASCHAPAPSRTRGSCTASARPLAAASAAGGRREPGWPSPCGVCSLQATEGRRSMANSQTAGSAGARQRILHHINCIPSMESPQGSRPQPFRCP